MTGFGRAFAAFGVAATALIAVSSVASAQEAGATAIFAGGCFWCVESDFDKVPGVLATTSGYTGGHLENPTYRDVVSETTGHYEAVEVRYDPAVVSYEELLEVFWHSVDPTDAGGQFCDRGESYRTAVFAAGPEQRQAAEASKAEADAALEEPVVTPVLDAQTFYPAEDYHQDYYRKNPLKYQFYRLNCGRDARVEAVWGDAAFSGIKDKVG